MTKNKRIITAQEEHELAASTERGEWVSTGDILARRIHIKEAATRTLDQINGDLIEAAINERRILSVTYKAAKRLVIPYILGYDDKGHLLLSAVQISGGSGTGFRTFRVAELTEISLSGKRVLGSHPDYNPRDPLFERVVAKVEL